MVNPRVPGKITLNDLLHCGVGETIVNMLTDAQGFWTYDNRENVIADNDYDDAEQDHNVRTQTTNNIKYVLI